MKHYARNQSVSFYLTQCFPHLNPFPLSFFDILKYWVSPYSLLGNTGFEDELPEMLKVGWAYLAPLSPRPRVIFIHGHAASQGSPLARARSTRRLQLTGGASSTDLENEVSALSCFQGSVSTIHAVAQMSSDPSDAYRFGFRIPPSLPFSALCLALLSSAAICSPDQGEPVAQIMDSVSPSSTKAKNCQITHVSNMTSPLVF